MALLRWRAHRALTSVAIALATLILSATRAHAGAVQVGDRVPAVTLTDWKGQPVALDDLRGRVTIIDFWASWCAACTALLPRLDALNREHAAAGLVVAAVNIDRTRAVADRFLAQHVPGATMTLVHDADAATLARFGAEGMPALYVVDGDGRVRLVAAGAAAEKFAAVEQLVKQLLSEISKTAEGGGQHETSIREDPEVDSLR